MPEEKYLNLGDYQLDEIRIENTDGTTVFLKDAFVGLNIQESIYNRFVSAQLVLIDSVDFAGLFPIIGGETVYFSFKTPVFASKKITMQMKVVNFERTYLSDNETTKAYLLTLVSPSFIEGTTKKISQTFSGTASQILGQLIKNHIPSLQDETRKVFIKDTNQKFKIVSPYWTPYGVMDYLKRRCFLVNKNSVDSSYIFFENIDGLHFVSINQLKKQEPKVKLNYIKRARMGVDVSEEKFLSGESLEYNRYFDRSFEFSNGVFRGISVNYDSTKKAASFKEFHYFDHEKYEENLLNEFSITPSNLTYLSDGVQEIDITNTQSIENENGQLNKRLNYLFHRERNSDIIRSRGQVITMRIPGNTDLRAGDLVYFEMPHTKPSKDEQNPFDPILTGNYIVSKIDHQLKKVNYFCNIEMIKDSVISPLQPAQPD